MDYQVYIGSSMIVQPLAGYHCTCALRFCYNHYVVYNPMTKKYEILMPSTHDVGHAIGEARLGFDPTASSHFHVIEYVGVNAVCVGVEIYSSQTTA